MWRTFYLLLLMLFTFDFPRDKLVSAEPVRVNAEQVTRDDEFSHREAQGVFSAADGEKNSAELLGKWRNNGEALEPKWRDGDTVPLLPFSHISRYSRDKIDNSEEEDDHEQPAVKYGQNNGRENSLRQRNKVRLPYSDYEHYELTENRREHREREETPLQKRNRPWSSEDTTLFKEISNRKTEPNRDFKENKEPSLKYRETFQARPNDYEHEFSDEEYLKPRPRKRRPPQNYEFALAKTENESIDNSKDWALGDPSEGSAKNALKIAHNELKSLLKMQQEEGLSLSEILQQRNLTLNDLLKGKADVINSLKLKDVKKSEDYTEEATKMMSTTFTKLSTTKKPQWVTESTKANSQRNEELVISILPGNSLHKNQTNARVLIRANEGKTYSEAAEDAITGKSTISVDSLQGRIEITTPIPLPIATNSMDLLQADDATVKSHSNGEIKDENLDEDEIMEFSDFTDYKKGRSGVSPVWLMMKNTDDSESVAKFKGQVEDKGSTLSIEKILSPTERSKSTNLSINSENTESVKHPTEWNYVKTKNEKNEEKDQNITMQHSQGDYITSSEKEYQNDEPAIYYNSEHNTKISSLNKSDANTSIIGIAQELESQFDAISQNSNNFTIEENRQADQKNQAGSAIKNNTDNTNNTRTNQDQNYQENTAEKKSYDEIISEVEPDARAEIFELFAAGSAGKRLERLLKSRNMSLEELIALRQRGSSKVHLAEVTRIRTQKANEKFRIKDTSTTATSISLTPQYFPEEGKKLSKTVNVEGNCDGSNNHNNQLTETIENMQTTTLKNFEHFKESTTEISNLGSNINSEDSEKFSEKGDLKADHRTMEIVDLLTTFGSLTYENNEDNKRKNSDIIFIKSNAETIRLNDTPKIIETGFVKKVIKEKPNSIDIQTVYSETSIMSKNESEGKNEKGKTLSKVKPSIIASGAILGVTLVVFLAIFIICRIRQKQKYRYRNTFSRAMFQGPVLTARKLSNSSSLSTVMVNVIATSTAKRPEKNETQAPTGEIDSKSDIDNDSLDANDSWETIPDYMK